MKIITNRGVEIDTKEIVTIAIREKRNGYEVAAGTKKYGYSVLRNFATEDSAKTYANRLREGLPV